MSSGDSNTLLLRRRDFPARISAFQEIKSFVETFGADASLHPEYWLKLVLLAEELFTNTVQHGYQGGSDARVEITLEALQKFIRLIYEDSAPPHDPLSAAERVDLQQSVEKRPVGGLGMLLTVRLTESASYSYVNQHNRVELLLARWR